MIMRSLCTRSLAMSLLAVSLLVMSSLTYAEESASASNVSNQGAYLAQVLLGLMAVLALILLMGWLLRRVGQGSLVGSQNLKIIASLSLGTREKIALVQVGEQQLLLGITPNAINHLQTFAEPVIDPLSPTPASSDFARRLKSFMHNKDGDKN